MVRVVLSTLREKERKWKKETFVLGGQENNMASGGQAMTSQGSRFRLPENKRKSTLSERTAGIKKEGEQGSRDRGRGGERERER